MLISSINNINFTDNKNIDKINKNKKLTANTAIVAGTTAVGAGVGFLVHRKKEKELRNEAKQIILDKDIYVSNTTEKLIERYKSLNLPFDENTIKKENAADYEKIFKTTEKFNELKKQSKKSFNNKVGIGIIAGLVVGVGVTVIKYFNTKQDDTSTNNSVSNVQAPSGYNFFLSSNNTIPSFDKFKNNGMKSSVSFSGQYLAGNYYTDKQVEIAEKIAPRKLEDWPKGLDKDNRYLYGIDDGIPIRDKPVSDREYQEILLKQEIEVPPKPPEYYRKGDKWFNTQRWKDYQSWPEYNRKKQMYDETYKLLNHFREALTKEEQRQIDERKQLHLNSAFAKTKLAKEFLFYLNSETKNKPMDIPNAVMMEGSNKEENINNIKWIMGSANARCITIDNENVNSDIAIARIETALEEAIDYYKKNNKRTLIYVKGFDKLITKNVSDEETISDVKEQLCNYSKEYKTTLLFETKNSNRLDPIALQNHRVRLKINLDKDITIDEFKKLQEQYLKSGLKPITDADGYRFNYLPGKNNFVDLYLGSFGWENDILWINSDDSEKIYYVVEFIEAIKSIPKFKNIQKIQCPQPTSIELLNDKFKPLDNYTKDFKKIYELEL